MPSERVNGVGLHYTQCGRGPDVLMVHGLGANLAFWALRVAPLLAREYRVTTYDLRGHGRSETPPNGYTVNDMAADLAGLLDALGMDAVHLVGHSFGGGVALRLAAQQPGRVRSLVLADAVLRGFPHRVARRAARRWAVVRRALEAMGIVIPEGFDVDGHELLDLLAEPGRQASRARWGADDLFLPFGAWNGAPRSAQRWHELLRSTTALAELNAPDGFDRAGLRAVGGPSLALYGELSRYLPTARVLQRDLPDCRIRLVPGVGHFHPMLKPGVFAQETSTFLREQGRT